MVQSGFLFIMKIYKSIPTQACRTLFYVKPLDFKLLNGFHFNGNSGQKVHCHLIFGVYNKLWAKKYRVIFSAI